MAWFVASIPFWLLGFIFVIGSPGCLKKRPGETDSEVALQAILCLAVGGIFLIAAAKIVS